MANEPVTRRSKHHLAALAALAAGGLVLVGLQRDRAGRVDDRLAVAHQPPGAPRHESADVDGPARRPRLESSAVALSDPTEQRLGEPANMFRRRQAAVSSIADFFAAAEANGVALSPAQRQRVLLALVDCQENLAAQESVLLSAVTAPRSLEDTRFVVEEMTSRDVMVEHARAFYSALAETLDRRQMALARTHMSPFSTCTARPIDTSRPRSHP